jgi:NAD(P)-dependent dehydrogenase (short-subunit alcohol dehydrogenase family)
MSHDVGTVLVTGATSGIGREAARDLGERGATVLVHGRDRERGRAVVETIRDETPGDAALYTADFAALDEVRELAAAVRDDHARLDALVNNAGCSRGERHGHELGGRRVEETLLVNHLAPYLLTHELVDDLVESAPARVVATSSAVHPRGELALDDLSLDAGYDAMPTNARSWRSCCSSSSSPTGSR